MLSGMPPTRAQNVGIHAVDIYFPRKYVDQVELEKHDGVSQGKYTIGLGQSKMGICDDREDINSICLTVVKSLLEKYGIAYNDIGRLEVGTETIIDKSKSVKSVLMQLFADSGNTDIEGIDTTNACYGGTNAVFNSVNWIESSAWDGRYALVVAADIAVYKSGAARPTGGAGAVALLIGADAPLVFDAGVRATHMEHVYDFYKPDLHSEYPEVDGPLSNSCYIKAVDVTYNRYLDKLSRQEGVENPTMDSVDYFVFHCPYAKLVAKSVGRLGFNDFLRNPDDERFAAFAQFKDLKRENTYTNREVEKAFMEYTKDAFKTKTLPSLLVAKNLGNSYCASVYCGLASLLSETPSSQLQNKRITLFSYGSGLAASMFSLTVRGDTSPIAKILNLSSRLADRTEIPPAEFDAIMNLREQTHNVKDYDPVSPVDERNFFPGTYYLKRVDEKFRRTYERVAAKGPVRSVLNGVNGTNGVNGVHSVNGVNGVKA
ncbi:hydroxymethylglutaryl-CoA synthase [Spizellomyces punctatus DAOM BR117]|uniref:Hydroxymethylglutaryl-CoA synthase n=1 Tax=Spizellomyces punctatus (strain DAOM BR117) TaxID=645134 RepID=A0A0L0HTA8_SPIPD|nr:hydroxymethylglutaryl-CoA synthase [Spizellomyces punctatus DAOM BR117]KND04342.1 hydroxymethylglutaryl-CoA synthase [Spizellomyces punctatus DAOM BR117]|eukprot:XP_016612381.1 hydroxymethylglutaryl-CoA synthase [Spizellomyces punctatus DAOM BR117]